MKIWRSCWRSSQPKAYETFFQIVIGTILFVAVILVGLISWAAYQMGQDSSERCENLRHVLFSNIDQAKEVRIIEHSNRWDYSSPDDTQVEKIYATVVLNASQIAPLKVAMFPSRDRSANTFHSCIFEPHHRIEIVNPDDSVSVVEICFVCGELDFGGGQRILPDGWDASLKTFISSLKMRPNGPWRIEDTTTGTAK